MFEKQLHAIKENIESLMVEDFDLYETDESLIELLAHVHSILEEKLEK
jgi:hypothetical protein